MEKFIDLGNYYLYLNFYRYLNINDLIVYIQLNKTTIKNKTFIYNLIFQELKVNNSYLFKYIIVNGIENKKYILNHYNINYYQINCCKTFLKKIEGNKYLYNSFIKYLKYIKNLRNGNFYL